MKVSTPGLVGPRHPWRLERSHRWPGLGLQPWPGTLAGQSLRPLAGLGHRALPELGVAVARQVGWASAAACWHLGGQSPWASTGPWRPQHVHSWPWHCCTIFFRPFLLSSWQAHVPQELGAYPLKIRIVVIRVSWCHFYAIFQQHWVNYWCGSWTWPCLHGSTWMPCWLYFCWWRVGQGWEVRLTFLSGFTSASYTDRHVVDTELDLLTCQVQETVPERSSAYLLSLYSRYWVVELTQLSRSGHNMTCLGLFLQGAARA